MMLNMELKQTKPYRLDESFIVHNKSLTGNYNPDQKDFGTLTNGGRGESGNCPNSFDQDCRIDPCGPGRHKLNHGPIV